jgi:ArsR family transcriptional regulator
MSKCNKAQLEKNAAMFKALSNPNRLRIFMQLVSSCAPGSKCETDAVFRKGAGEIGQGLNIAPTTVSHHLKELRTAGIIRTERNGQKVECWIDPDILEGLSEFFASHRN